MDQSGGNAEAAAAASTTSGSLLDEYQFNECQRELLKAIKEVRNMPESFANLDEEELIWAVAVETIDLPESPTASDKRFYLRKIEKRIRQLDEAERRFHWFSAEWTKPLMRKLITNWSCGTYLPVVVER